MVMDWLDGVLNSVKQAVVGSDADSGPGQAAKAAELGQKTRSEAPVIWLIGKTGAGKSAIVATLTGDERATIGEGYEPCTRTSRLFDFPADAPLVRFLDTRGLEEPGYNPTEDLAWCENNAHLVLAAMRVGDPAQERVLAVLDQALRRHRDWPLVVAQTTLHALYPAGQRHPATYPFTGGEADETDPALPHGLRQALAHQRRTIQNLPISAPRFVPVDFTRPGDGYEPHDFGVDALLAALRDAGLTAVANALTAKAGTEADEIYRGCQQLLYAYAGVAAGGAVIPLPFVDVGTLVTVNGLMLRALGERYGVEWTVSDLGLFFAAIGTGGLLWFAIKFGLRELLKLVPVVGWGAAATLNGVAAFGLTAGIGESACVWLKARHQGRTAPSEDIQAAFARGFRRQPPADKP
jgi:uncharacterized protein (DUF697 family)